MQLKLMCACAYSQIFSLSDFPPDYYRKTIALVYIHNIILSLQKGLNVAKANQCAHAHSSTVTVSFIKTFSSDFQCFTRSQNQLCTPVAIASLHFTYTCMIFIYIMYVSYCYISHKCCTAIQETCIPSEMCAGETCITDGKHASLVICVWRNTHPQGYVCGKHFAQ